MYFFYPSLDIILTIQNLDEIQGQARSQGSVSISIPPFSSFLFHVFILALSLSHSFFLVIFLKSSLSRICLSCDLFEKLSFAIFPSYDLPKKLSLSCSFYLNTSLLCPFYFNTFFSRSFSLKTFLSPTPFLSHPLSVTVSILYRYLSEGNCSITQRKHETL